MTYKSSARGIRPVQLVAVHTAEGARTARTLGAYFYRDDVQASSHVGIDAVETLQYVTYDRASWTLRSGNPISDNAELCAFAHWTRAQWLGTDTVDGCANPLGILTSLARWIAQRCNARGIPIIKLSPAEVAAGKSGVIGHVDWTLGMKDGTHVDPGKTFPWDYVIAQANGEVDMTPEEHDILVGLNRAIGATFAAGKGLLGDVLLRVETKIDAGFENLSDDEANIITALRALDGDGLTEDQYARIIADRLPSAVLDALVTLAQERDTSA